MSASTYVQITLPEMEDLLVPLEFKRIDLGQNVKEVVLARPYKRVVQSGDQILDTMYFQLRVYTSIRVTDKTARGVGEDAIRVCAFYYKGTLLPLGKTRRVHRVEGWRNNLLDRIENWWEYIFPTNERCPDCDSPMRLIKPGLRDRWSEFYGCIRYPKCSSTRKVN